MRSVWRLVVLSFVACGTVVVGCGASRREVSLAADAGELVDVGVIAPAPGGDPFCKAPHCSSDLHTFVDCDANVLSRCADDQGCTTGGCRPACEAANTNKSSIGCEYYVVQPDMAVGATGGCFAAFVANNWSTPAKIAVDYDGQALDASTFTYIATGTGQNVTYAPVPNAEIPPGEVAIVFLSSGPSIVPGTNCPPVNAALKTDAAFHGTGIGHAFHVTSSVPVVAYDIFPYGGGSTAVTSATLLLPTSAWDTSYIGIEAWPGGHGVAWPVLAIAAQADDTEVTIKPSAPIVAANGVAGASAGMPQTYALARGQVLQFSQGNGLSGSIVRASKPVGMWAGKTVLALDDGCCLDSAHQQVPPVRAFGSEYVGVRYRNRYDGVEEIPPWRITGAADGTVLTWEPARPPGAPETLARGQGVEFDCGSPFVVRSQDAEHPFYMAAYMTGAGRFDPSKTDGRGDPEFVNVIPSLEYLESYVFFADPTYPETNLVVVRRRGAGGFADVVLDCAGPLGDWKPIGTSNLYEYTWFDLVRHNFQGQGNCNNGRHEMHSKNAFGLTVWGWGSAETGKQGAGFFSQYVSYAYPAGAGVAPINTLVIDPLK